MKKLVFDIETIGHDFDSFDTTTQDMLTRWIRKESASDEEYTVALEDLKNELGFSPLTGEIVAIGVMDCDFNRGAVYFQTNGHVVPEFEENGIKYKPCTEKEMLQHFWTLAERVDEFVSFNGRAFDAPWLMVRSAAHGIRPTRDLMEGRYFYQQRSCKHVDLQDLLCYYGAMRKKGSLHMWCRLFNIASPKAGGVDGDGVADLFKAGKCEDIARYNAADLHATKALYDHWQKYLCFT